MIRYWLAATLRGEAPTFEPGILGSVDEVLEVARENGVSLFLLERIKLDANTGGCPQALLDRLAEIELNEVASEMLRRFEANRILSSLENAGIPVIVLKGTALAYGLYAKPYLRPRGDTDILLQNALYAEAATAVLKKEGYVSLSLMPKPSQNAISFEVEYRRTSKYGTQQSLDIHWALANNALYGGRFTNEELLVSARELPLLGAGIRGLGWVHAMAHACIHRVAHLPEGLGGRLIWLYDIHLLAAKFSEQDWAQFLHIARERQLAGAFTSGLEATVDAFHTVLPDQLLPTLQKLAKKEHFKVVKASSSAYIDLHSVYWMTSGQRWHWFMQTFFPPVKYMMERDGLKNRAQLPWAYARRIFRRFFRRA